MGRQCRERGAWVVYRGIHATLYPDEALERGQAHAVVKGDGDQIWATVLADDNFYPVTLADLAQAARRADPARLRALEALRDERFETFDATADLADRAELTFAQFVPLTPFPGTLDFAKWEQTPEAQRVVVGLPVGRHWLIPYDQGLNIYVGHPTMTVDEIRRRTQAVWDRFYSFPLIWRRARCVEAIKARLAFVLISKLYRQMYANTGTTAEGPRYRRWSRRSRWTSGGVKVLAEVAESRVQSGAKEGA